LGTPLPLRIYFCEAGFAGAWHAGSDVHGRHSLSVTATCSRRPPAPCRGAAAGFEPGGADERGHLVARQDPPGRNRQKSLKIFLPLAALCRYPCAWKMAYFSTEPASERRNVTGKNRVWDFFRLSNETHPANRRQPAQPRRKIAPTATKPVSGIPYWPSRDPIGEQSVARDLELGTSNTLESLDSFRKSVQLTVTKKDVSQYGITTQVSERIPDIDELLSGYVFVANDPVSRLDVLGLTLYACLTPTMGGNATHAFVYSTKLGSKKGEWGMHGCSGTALGGDGGGDLRPDLKNCREITVPRGMSEKEAFEKIKNWEGWHKGIWCPWANDCHGQLEDAVKAAGLGWPGLPGGRLIQPGDPCCKFDPKGSNPLDPPGGPIPASPRRF